MILNPDIEIKESPIQGKGLFTKVPIKKRQQIWISKGEEPVEENIYTKEEFKDFQKWCIENGKQWDSVSLPDGTIKAAVSDRANHPENYGNHSCEPNMGKNHVALRNIEAGEELTVDYTQFSDKDWSMECNCGAKSCKGVVKGAV
ncbi:SET domain-containing protein-lysine N-methyltransferase [Candidatus Saccharibacteria bacterium]|nr:SET domain-containing protein-lysine N-methyltransferase [Candidatus Saccharibacteria bacterium]